MNDIIRKEILEIKNNIIKNFKESDWLELGYLTDSYEEIRTHERLLKSLHFGDDDYEKNVIESLDFVVKKEPQNLDKIKFLINEKYSIPMVFEFISTAHKEVPKKNISFLPQVFEIPDNPQNSNLVAVMLPFTMPKTFQAIKNVCNELNLECKKADDIWENSTFIQDIFELIFTSKVVIADFTNRNPNVFYEVGIAHTLGKTVIPVTQIIEHIPSDLKHHRGLLYYPNEQGYIDMQNALKEKLQILFPSN